LLKDITTGALRRKRGAADDLDLSDEEDANARRREAKRREFARMRRELLKDEAVGKIAEDKKKQAFLKSIEDREEAEDEDEAFHEEEENGDSQSQPQHADEMANQAEISTSENRLQRKRPLEPSAADITNRLPPALRRNGNKSSSVHRKPSNLAEIREHLSFLIEETDSQNRTPDTFSSDDEEGQEPEAYVNLNRHLHQADDEHEDGDEGLADFIVDDERPAFKKPELPTTRAPANERRTKPNVIDRLSLLRQSSSSSSLTTSTSHAGGSKLAFFSSKSSSNLFTFKVPSLLRRATTTSSVNSESGASRTSATGVTVTERGAVEHEKEMIRKAQGGKRSAINYYAKGRVEEREKERVRLGRVGKSKKTTAKRGKGGFLGGLFGTGGSWE
jgi:mediator of replication checkpoint protein 1